MTVSAPPSDARFCEDAVRTEDSDRYLIAFFQPRRLRQASVALAAWNLELARARPRSGETAIGLMRLQWHRDALAEIRAGAPRRHPVIGELAAAHAAGLIDLALLERVVDARERDLDAQPAANLSELEAYARGTYGLLHRALWSKTPAADAAEDAAAAFALIGLARAEPANQARGRPWAPKAFRGGLRPLVDRAAELARTPAPKGHRGVRAPAVLAAGYAERAVQAGSDPTKRLMAEADPWRIWRLYRARLLGAL